MKVKKITVKNLKAISDMSADFNWCTAIVTWWNNKWKSTFLRSFVDRIRWEKPSEVIKHWETEWYCEYELTDWSKFIWQIVWQKESLSFITKDWLEINSWVIKNLWNKFFWESFDIDEFLNSQPKKQKQTLQKVLGINLDDLEAEYKKAYDERTEKNTIYKNEKAKADWLTNTVFHFELKRIDTTELRNKLIEAEKWNQNYNYVEKWLIDKKAQLNDIEEEIKKLEEKKSNIKEDINKWEEYLKKNIKIDIDSIKKEIDDAVKNNELIDANEYTEKQLENVEITKKDWEIADKKVKEIEKKKTDIIQSVNMPEWFEFTDEWLLYKWFELDKNQLSSSSIYIASLKLASMWLWDIKTLCFDASYLDKNSLQEIENWASDNWLQLLIERPDFDWGELKYEIIS